jgi:hypothetical protein
MPPAVVKRLDLPEVPSVPKRSKALGASFSRLPPVRPKTAAIVRWVAEGEQRKCRRALVGFNNPPPSRPQW